MNTYYTKDMKSGRTDTIQAKNIQNLRSILIHSAYSWGSKVKVFTNTGNLQGEYQQGMNGGYWLTPKGGLYELFKDGSFRGKY